MGAWAYSSFSTNSDWFTMPIFEDDAIVLRQYPIADSDRIVVSIGSQLGKFRAVAQGIKKPKNRLTGCLEPLNHIRISLYSREGSDLARVRQAELIHSYSGKIDSLEHIFAFAYFTELVHTLVQDNQPNPVLFRLLLATLKAGEKKAPVLPMIRYFEVWCLKISGLYPNYDYCSECGKYVKDLGFFARVYEGLSLCRQCGHNKDLWVGADASRALQAMMVMAPDTFAARPIDEETCSQLEQLTRSLLNNHIESPMKSYSVLKKLLE